MTGQHEDEDAYATLVAEDRQPENRVRLYVDAAGYAVMRGGWYGMEFERAVDVALEFLSFLRECRERYPLDPADIVMPSHALQRKWFGASATQWPLDPDGRGLTVLEMEQMQAARKARAAA